MSVRRAGLAATRSVAKGEVEARRNDMLARNVLGGGW